MLESKEQIDFALSKGETLTFATGVLRGFSGHTLYRIQNLGSPSEISRQDIDFQVSREAFEVLGVQPLDTFTFEVKGREYLFRLKSYMDDLTGWLELTTNLVETELV